ncbi:MAG: PilZ domain-containing protein [Hyphomicrobiaceae bacterium]|nr:PilZ domain-containing protein [Hyphomicrobiaceae bacterium]
MLKEAAIAKLRAEENAKVVSRRASTRPRFQRVKVSILGRYMLENKSEYPCQIISMSPGDADVIAPVPGQIGERVIGYVDHIGRIEGSITNIIDGGFEMDIAASPRKRDKMANQLTWLANKDELNLPEDRRHERVVPDERHAKLVLQDGRKYTCKIIDFSLSGVAIEMHVRPAIGTPCTIGRMRARVVRHFHNGVALEFTTMQQMVSVVQQNLRIN